MCAFTGTMGLMLPFGLRFFLSEVVRAEYYPLPFDTNMIITPLSKSSSTFMVPLLDRKMPADGPDLQAYAEAGPDLRNLYITSGDTAAIMIVQPDGTCTMHAGLSLKKENGVVSKVLLNSSNTEFSPGMVDKAILDNYVTIVTRRDAANEPFGMKGEVLNEDDLRDTSLNAINGFYLVSYPRTIPLGYVVDGWIEGNIMDPDFLDTFQDKYGDLAGLWLRRAKTAIEQESDDIAVFRNLQDDDHLASRLGQYYDTGNVTRGSLMTYTRGINQSSSPAEYDAIKRSVGPFQVMNVPQQIVGASGITAANVAAIIETSDDRKEKKRLKSGHTKCLAFYIAGDVDFEAGTLTSLTLPTPTKAFSDALGESTLEERAESLKRLLDSNNAFRPQEMLAIANDRDMDHHDILLVKSIVTGRFSPAPLVKLNQKSTQATFAHWLKVSSDKMKKNLDELERADARAHLLVESTSTREDLIVPDSLSSLNVVNTGIANFSGDSDAMFVSTTANNRPLVTQSTLFLYKILKDGDVKKMLENMCGEENLNFAYHCVARLDQFMSKIAKAGNDFDTNTEIATGTVNNIKLDAYKKAVTCFADDCKDIIKAANGGTKLNPSISIRPVEVPHPEPKRQKFPDNGGNNRSNNQNNGGNYHEGGNHQGPRGNGQGNQGRGNQDPRGRRPGRNDARRNGSWDGGWGASRPAFQRDPEEGRKRGSLFARNGFDNVLAPTLSERHCPHFHVMTRTCTGECTKIHVPMNRWTESNKDKQMAHVERNKDQVLFHPNFGRCLPDDKKHLIKRGESNGE